MSAESMWSQHWELPYPSLRRPLLAQNVVTTSAPLAAQAGLGMLLKGGNAVDAAVAAAIALTIVEPTSNGIGGDLFAIVWDRRRCHGLNASGRSPNALDAGRIIAEGKMPQFGWDTVTVPGVVSGWVALSERFGALDFSELFQPALRYAEKGFPVGPDLAVNWDKAVKSYPNSPGIRDLYTHNGRSPMAGEIVTFPDQAKTLRQIAESHGNTFYHGDLATRIDEYARAEGGALRHEDLATHAARWVDPIALDFGTVSVHELPPNGQGLAALIALGILDRTPYREYPVNTALSLHYEIEAMKLGLAVAQGCISDPDAMELTVEELLAPELLERYARDIDPERARDRSHGPSLPGGTVFVTAADDAGWMVSLIQSTYVWFGSGIVVPGTGIALQNRGACFSCQPGHPNVVAPGKLPLHTIIPGFVTDGQGAVCSFGLVGGPMQPQGHVQLLARSEIHGENAQAALAAPRWRVESGLEVAVESAVDSDVVVQLRERGHQVTVVDEKGLGWHGFGLGQMIVRLSDAYVAASDPREGGQPAGF